MVSLVHTWMRNMSEMMLLLPILWFLPLTGAAPSLTTEQLDTGVVSFLFYLLKEKEGARGSQAFLSASTNELGRCGFFFLSNPTTLWRGFPLLP